MQASGAVHDGGDDAVLASCLRALTPPAVLRPGFEAGGDDGKDEGAWARSCVWVDRDAPAALAQLHALLPRCLATTRPEADTEERRGRVARIVVAAARLWTPPLRTASPPASSSLSPAVLHSVLRPEEEGGRAGLRCDDWLTDDLVAKADAILSDARLGDAAARLEVAAHLLQHYVRPLFSAATASRANLDADTGRARRADPLLAAVPATSVSSSSAAAAAALGGAQGNVELWKGSARRSGLAERTEVLGTPVQFAQDGGHTGDDLRDAALGCWNVLAWCLLQIGRAGQDPSASSPASSMAAAASSAAAWEQHWPLVLPPLLTLLEDAEPHFRLVGTRILLTTMLDPTSNGPEGAGGSGGVPASLLLRTNVVPLLLSSLETSYTFITGERSHVLLDAALGAARRLALLTTAPIEVTSRSTEGEQEGEGSQSRQPAAQTAAAAGGPTTRQTWIAQDHGAARAQQLAAILTDGIFKVWSFPVRASATTASSLSAKGKGTGRIEHRVSLRHDLIRVTFRWLRILVLGGTATATATATAIAATATTTTTDPSSSETSHAPTTTVTHRPETALGLLSARFLGIVCEFVGSWVEREFAGTWALHAPKPQSRETLEEIAPPDLGLSSERQGAAARLLGSAEAVFGGVEALLLASASASVSDGADAEAEADAKAEAEADAARLDLDVPPGIETWAGRVLLASARLWTLLHDAGLTREFGGADVADGPIVRGALEVRRTLRRVWEVYGGLAPQVTDEHRSRLLKLDAAVFTSLCQT